MIMTNTNLPPINGPNGKRKLKNKIKVPKVPKPPPSREEEILRRLSILDEALRVSNKPRKRLQHEYEKEDLIQELTLLRTGSFYGPNIANVVIQAGKIDLVRSIQTGETESQHSVPLHQQTANGRYPPGISAHNLDNSGKPQKHGTVSDSVSSSRPLTPYTNGDTPSTQGYGNPSMHQHLAAAEYHMNQIPLRHCASQHPSRVSHPSQMIPDAYSGHNGFVPMHNLHGYHGLSVSMGTNMAPEPLMMQHQPVFNQHAQFTQNRPYADDPRPAVQLPPQGYSYLNNFDNNPMPQPTALSTTRREKPPKAPPSMLSGGVPEASMEYRLKASVQSWAVPHPTPILLVLDLNGTLLHRPDRARPKSFTSRPMTSLFLEYVSSRFHIMIWSSAKPENVTAMVNKLFTEPERNKLIAVWGRDKFDLTEKDYNRKVQVYKRLEKVWASPAIQARHPYAGADVKWDQTNTILVDDSKEKARSEPFNLLEIPEFFNRPDDRQDTLRLVAEYLELCVLQTNVSNYMKDRPFVV